MRKIFSFALLATSLLVGQLCWAQSTNHGAIVGTLADPDGRAIPAVNLKLTNVNTGSIRDAETNQNGDYRIDFVQPGVYLLTAERTGFKKTEMTNITVQVGQVQRIDITLSVGQISEEITIASDEGAPINTESSTLGEVIDNTKIQNLPLNGREYLKLAALVPGAESGNPKRGAVYSKGVSVGFNGARAQYNAYSVDGADSTDANYNQLISSPALDAIKEFRVETNMYSAQYGRSGGAMINVVTNSGTNDYHGSLYEYHRNKWLDSAPAFDRRPYDQRPQFLFNQFGGSVGGPIVVPRFGEGGPALKSLRNKTFFFFSAEGFRQVKPGEAMVSFAPTDKERIGDLSETINPFTGQLVVLRNPFTGEIIPGNKVPENLINPVGKRLMELWPKPNYNDPFLNLRMFRSGSIAQNKWLVRIDQHFSEKDTLSGTFNYGNYDNTSVWHTIYGDTKGYEYDRTLGLTYTHVFTNNLVNDFKFSRIRYKAGSDFVLADKNYGKEWGIYTNNTSGGSPRILMYTQGYQRFDIGNGGGSNRDNTNLYIKDNFVWVKDNHTISMGGDFKRQQYDWLYESTGAGGAYYFGLLEGDPNYSQYYLATGSVFSSLLMGVTPYMDFGLQEGQANLLRRNMFAVFVQDDWKVTPRLTLNLGLRYDQEAPFSESNNKFATLNFETGKVVYAKGAPKLDLVQFPYESNGPNRPYEASKLSFSPRVGFAYRPFNDSSTAVRGGYGIFYTSEIAFSTVYGSWVAPFAGQFHYSPKANFLGEPNDHFVTIDKPQYRVNEFAGKSPGFALFNAPYYPQGYMQQWNLAVARDLGKNFALELAYVGSKGTNLNGSTSTAAYSQDLAAKIQSFIPGFSPGIRIKGFNSKYNSFQAKLTKRLSNGLSFLASFTWAHAMAESSNDDAIENILSDADAATGNFTVRRYSNADFDVPKRFVLSGDYELPIGKGKSFGREWGSVADTLIGGWTLNYIFQLQDGYPYTVYNSSLRFPDRVCDGKLPKSERSVRRWFDISCFPNHPSHVVTGPNGKPITVGINGNAGPNIIRGPGFNNLDLGIHKNFRFTESNILQLRFEAFNFFNRANYVGPSGTYFFNTASGAALTRARDNRDIQLAIKFLF